MKLLLFLLSLWPLAALGSHQVSLGNIRMHMRSSFDSDPEDFPIRVLSQSFLFMDQIFKNAYADAFERLSLSINSRGIESDNNGGFIVAVDLTGTAYFESKSNLSEKDVTLVLKDAFRKYNDLFLEILADSIDPFLSEISYAIVIVDGDSVVDEVVSDSSSDSNLPVWVIAVIAAGAGFVSILALCLCFIFCLGDPDEESNDVPEVTKTSSRDSKKSNSTAVSSKDDRDEESATFPNEHQLETRSFTSQDSSMFTYNPKSVYTSNGTTVASFHTNVSNMDNHVENWRQSSTMNQSTPNAFGTDISGIVDKRDLSHIQERDEECGSSSSVDLSALKGLHIQTDEHVRGHGVHERHSFHDPSMSRDVIDDLNDLSHQVAMHRQSSAS